VRERIRSLPRRFRQESSNGLRAQWDLRIGDREFAVSVAGKLCTVEDGRAALPDVVLTTAPEVWIAIDDGALSGGQALVERRLSVTGNLDLAVRLQTLFRPYQGRRRGGELDQVDIVADGVRLSCYLQGRGTPVLLLHGLGGGKTSLFPLMPELAESHRVIVPDLPGHGESAKPAADYTPRYYARVARCLLDQIGVKSAVVIGNSMGGRIAMEMGLRSPGRVTALGLLGPAVPGFRWRYVMGFTRVLPAEFGAIPFPLRERWTRALLRRLFADPDRLGEEVLAAAAHEFIRIYRTPAARMAFLSSFRHLVTERPEPFFASLRRIKQPTVILFGERDRLVPPKLGARLAQHLPNARLMVLPGVGHVPQFEAPRETLDALLGLMAEAPPGAPSMEG
jgi:pimeloyl-ACP methyl ester carboxylesterase/putative sterol carrier protein